jgi:hypothetical protein
MRTDYIRSLPSGNREFKGTKFKGESLKRMKPRSIKA